jgi:hypothetical protein
VGYLPPTTVAETIGRIHSGDLVLPAIQREFVWEAQQVTALFDSLMRGYPIGGFLSWQVRPDTASQFKFYGFLKDYNEFSNRYCPQLDIPPQDTMHAILDGQQRLTSLNVGLRGSYAYRSSGAWRTKASSYPQRRLYLNVLREAGENEAGMLYDFRLLTGDQVRESQGDPDVLWFPVSEVYKNSEVYELWAKAAEFGVANDPGVSKMLGRLWEAVHKTQSLHFYEETDQDVERVLDIFIRVNSGGTPLSYSDLLLSIATAQWDKRDAREAIHGLVETLNTTGQGFKFSQDAILKSGLVLAGISDFAFRVKNFNTTNMQILQKEWDNISQSLELAVGLLHDFGLSEANLTADSVLIPVAYYVHRRKLTESYRAAPKHSADRELLRSWVLRSLVMPGVWGSGLDTLLRDLRDTIDLYGADGFPVVEIEVRMALRGKSLTFSDEQIEDLLHLAYGRKRTFATLALLFPYVNTRNLHHVDHIFPKALLYKNLLKAQGFSDADIDEMQALRDELPNLQLLEGPVNVTKSATEPAAWAQKEYPTPAHLEAYLDRNALPELPASAHDFRDFFSARKVMLEKRMKSMLSTPPTIGSHATAPET